MKKVENKIIKRRGDSGAFIFLVSLDNPFVNS